VRIEILTIGNELLNGDLADTNTARLGGWLRRQGLPVAGGRTVPDDVAVIAEALAAAARVADLVLVSGGLGPTEDDLTMAAAARFAGVGLVEDGPTRSRLEERFRARGYPFTPNNARQALAPAGAEVLDNPVGTAPCVRLTHGATTFFFFPGVPHELERLVADHLAPWIAQHAGARPYHSVLLKTFGRTESQVATLLSALPLATNLHVAYRAHFPEIHVGFHVQDPDAAAARGLLDDVSRAARDALGPIVFAHDAAGTFAGAVAERLGRAGATLAVAESCTGGLASAMCTALPGASSWFVEGLVAYANEAKARHLGVPTELIAAAGAVSEPVARAMAEGVRARSGATFGVAITGVAGPTGASPDKPVGTVHFALAGPGGTSHLHRRLPFDRERNRVVSAYLALDMVRRGAPDAPNAISALNAESA